MESKQGNLAVTTTMAQGKLLSALKHFFIDFRVVLMDTIFPVKCIGCGKEKEFLCQQCAAKMTVNTNFFCPGCGQPSFRGNACFHCRDRMAVDGLWVGGNYQNPLLRDCIKAFKYHNVIDLSEKLSSLLISHIRHIASISPGAVKVYDFIIPVPLHRRRFYERGFNQAELLAVPVSRELGIPIRKDIIRRWRFTGPQARLDDKDRKSNIIGSFKIINNIDVKGKSILLIDDVLTSGSTINECAKILKAANAKNVWALVVARG